eukprot:3591168-Prymnesium_polylepis.1
MFGRDTSLSSAAADAATMSKSAAKNAKADAGKASKKRPDPEGLKLIEEGDKAFEAKDFEKAVALFTEAKAKCEASTVEAVAKEKKPKADPAPAAAAQKGAADPPPAEERKPKLYLSDPKENLQAKPLRAGVDDVHNYAKNTAAQLKAHLAETHG